MNKTSKSINSNHQKSARKDEGNSSGKMRFLYVLILVMMILSLFTRVSGARQPNAGTTARVLIFHQEDKSVCEDLTITAAGNAVFSNCGNGIEKQYTLNDAERSELQRWLATYSSVNYERSEPATRLYLNGQGRQQADAAETRQILGFAAALAARINTGS